MPTDESLTLLVIARIPAAGVADFRAYEDRVLPLLAGHGGELQRRLANADGTLEAHIVRFGSAAAFAAFRADPRRAAAAPILAASRATVEVTEMWDVPTQRQAAVPANPAPGVPHPVVNRAAPA